MAKKRPASRSDSAQSTQTNRPSEQSLEAERSLAKEAKNQQPRLRDLKDSRPKGIYRLLGDETKLLEAQELVESGASVGTVEAKLGLEKGQLRKYLDKGERLPNSPYRRLYNMYRRWAGEARAVAESNQLAKSPGQWLEANTSARLLEDREDKPTNAPVSGVPAGPTQNIDQSGLLRLGAQAALGALSALIESGLSIDEHIRKGQLALNEPTELESDEPDK